MSEQPIQPTPILTPPAPEAAGKKHSKLILLLLLVPFVVIGVVICLLLKTQYKPKFEVNGAEFKLGTKAGDLMNQGLELCNYTYGYGTYLKADDEIPAGGLDTEYYIVVKGTDPEQTNTGMRVTLANDSGKAKRAADCRVFSVIYYPWTQSGDVKVLIDGQDFSSVGRDNQLREKIEKAGMPFKKNEMNEFFDKDVVGMLGQNLFCRIWVTNLSPVIPDGISFTFERRFTIRGE